MFDRDKERGKEREREREKGLNVKKTTPTTTLGTGSSDIQQRFKSNEAVLDKKMKDFETVYMASLEKFLNDQQEGRDYEPMRSHFDYVLTLRMKKWESTLQYMASQLEFAETPQAKFMPIFDLYVKEWDRIKKWMGDSERRMTELIRMYMNSTDIYMEEQTDVKLPQQISEFKIPEYFMDQMDMEKRRLIHMKNLIRWVNPAFRSQNYTLLRMIKEETERTGYGNEDMKDFMVGKLVEYVKEHIDHMWDLNQDEVMDYEVEEEGELVVESEGEEEEEEKEETKIDEENKDTENQNRFELKIDIEKYNMSADGMTDVEKTKIKKKLRNQYEKVMIGGNINDGDWIKNIVIFMDEFTKIQINGENKLSNLVKSLFNMIYVVKYSKKDKQLKVETIKINRNNVKKMIEDINMNNKNNLTNIIMHMGYIIILSIKKMVNALRKSRYLSSYSSEVYMGYRDWETDRKSTRLNYSHRL